jgi:carotenoid cleavage dioxygenase
MTEYVFSDAPKNGDGEKGPQTKGGLPWVSRYFSDENTSGFMRPVRFEGEISNLEVIGSIPESIEGTFYRVMPEPHFPSFIPNDPVCQREHM